MINNDPLGGFFYEPFTSMIESTILMTWHLSQWRSQNAENLKHIKGRLLEQAVILLIASLFIMGTSLKGKNLFPEGANPFL